MQLLDATDQTVYKLVHQVLAANSQVVAADDRRNGPRHRYPCLQWVAPYQETSLPDVSDFVRVRCEDISPGGFAFIEESDAQDRLTSPYVVVALGFGQPLFMIAEIVRRRTVASGLGPRVLFGCRFLGRIMDSDYRPDLNG